jgi:hypothetical protein
MADKWEYMWVAVGVDPQGSIPVQTVSEFPMATASETLQHYLNRLGDDGWELVGVNPTSGVTTGPVLYFKRRKQ